MGNTTEKQERTKGFIHTVRDSNEFKLEKFIEYFTSKKRIDVTDKNYEAAISLDKMIEIYNSDNDSLRKYYQMTQIFKNGEAFNKKYDYLKEYLNRSDVYYLYVYIEQIALFLRSIENKLTKESAKTLLGLEKNSYFEDYPFAEYFVRRYVEFNNSPYLRDFLNDAAIQEDDFSRFVNIIIELDEPLYDEYLAKVEDNKLMRKSETIRKMNNIKSGVTTGFTEEGYAFDEVEFYANLPFDDMESSKEIIEDFGFKKLPAVDKRFRTTVEELCPDTNREIMNYVYDKRLLYGNPVKISEDYIMKTSFIINDQPLSNEDKEIIISYMKERNIPFLITAFNAVKNKYLANKLEKQDVKSLEKKNNK